MRDGERQRSLIDLETVNIRDFGLGSRQQVDDSPLGGGAGQVLRPDVAAAAIDSVDLAGRPLIFLTPRGKPIDQKRIKTLADGPGCVLFCARFEGLDERVIAARNMEELSLGNFVLAGGETAAIALIEASVRRIPGVLGQDQSLAEESFDDGLLEYPQYTRPRQWEGRSVPEVLLSGHHQRIRSWRRQRAIEDTRDRRPDLNPDKKSSLE